MKNIVPRGFNCASASHLPWKSQETELGLGLASFLGNTANENYHDEGAIRMRHWYESFHLGAFVLRKDQIERELRLIEDFDGRFLREKEHTRADLVGHEVRQLRRRELAKMIQCCDARE